MTTVSFWSPFIRSGTQSLLFHGTNRACLLGENDQNVLLCGLPKCSLCTILRESFDVNKCGEYLGFISSHHSYSCHETGRKHKFSRLVITSNLSLVSFTQPQPPHFLLQGSELAYIPQLAPPVNLFKFPSEIPLLIHL